MQLENLVIRQAVVDDIQKLRDMAVTMKAVKDADYFDLAMEHQGAGHRLVFIAEHEGQAVGYCMLSWVPKYAFFKTLGFPEIQDLNVLPDFRKRGIASAMIAHCEGLAQKKGLEHMGIGVGLDASFGAAQRLYVKLGYVPDGNGVTHDRKQVAAGEFRPVDDNFCLMMVKELD